MLFLEDFSATDSNNKILEPLSAYDGVKFLSEEYSKYYNLSYETCFISPLIKKEFLKFLQKGRESYLEELASLKKLFKHPVLLNSLIEKTNRAYGIKAEHGFKKKKLNNKSDILNKQISVKGKA